MASHLEALDALETARARQSQLDENGLKPCPFCGGKAHRLDLDETQIDHGGSVIECGNCNASSAVEFGHKEHLVDRWNRRVK